MTRDEAITIMQVYKEELEHRIAKIDYDVGAIDLYSIQVEAYDMAIEALQDEAVQADYRLDEHTIYCSPQIAENVKVVVRCKDCINFDHAFNYCDFLEAGVEGEDFFCSYGERKGGGSE